MTFVVLYDASVLYPSTLRDLLIRIAQSGLVQAKWSDDILDEMFAALRRQRPDLDPARLDRTRSLMCTAIRDWKVTGYAPLIDALKLPDPDDRHVLAAAIKAKAQVIVTANLRDFPPAELHNWDIDPKSPDDFVRDQISLDRSRVYASVQQIADSWKAPPATIDDVLDRLERCGLALSVAELRSPA
ncbi:PIN domain-containing protein [Actinoplanes sp. CA-131856]